VCPSGSAITTCVAAMLAEPPGRFSTTTFCPRIGASAFARMRAMVSTVPPAAKPTMMRSGRSGNAARAMRGAAISAVPAPSSARLVIARKLLLHRQANNRPGVSTRISCRIFASGVHA
jgi:hypothetical protein